MRRSCSASASPPAPRPTSSCSSSSAAASSGDMSCELPPKSGPPRVVGPKSEKSLPGLDPLATGDCACGAAWAQPGASTAAGAGAKRPTAAPTAAAGGADGEGGNPVVAWPAGAAAASEVAAAGVAVCVTAVAVPGVLAPPSSASGDSVSKESEREAQVAFGGAPVGAAPSPAAASLAFAAPGRADGAVAATLSRSTTRLGRGRVKSGSSSSLGRPLAVAASGGSFTFHAPSTFDTFGLGRGWQMAVASCVRVRGSEAGA